MSILGSFGGRYGPPLWVLRTDWKGPAEKVRRRRHIVAGGQDMRSPLGRSGGRRPGVELHGAEEEQDRRTHWAKRREWVD